MNSFLMMIIVFLIMIMVLIPLPSNAIIVCFILDLTFSSVIFGLGLISRIKTIFPKAIGKMFVYFTLFTLAAFLASFRLVFLWRPDQNNSFLISEMANLVFTRTEIPGYILFAIEIFATIYFVYRVGKKNNSMVIGCVQFLRGMIKVILLITIICIISTLIIGMKTMNLKLIDSAKTFFPLCCSTVFIYFIPVLFASIGLNLVKPRKNDI